MMASRNPFVSSKVWQRESKEFHFGSILPRSSTNKPKDKSVGMLFGALDKADDM